MRHLLEHDADALGLSPAQRDALRAAFKGEEDGDEEVDTDGGERLRPRLAERSGVAVEEEEDEAEARCGLLDM